MAIVRDPILYVQLKIVFQLRMLWSILKYHNIKVQVWRDNIFQHEINILLSPHYISLHLAFPQFREEEQSIFTTLGMQWYTRSQWKKNSKPWAGITTTKKIKHVIKSKASMISDHPIIRKDILKLEQE